MITRQEIKARGKLAFKANYWKCVLVSLIIIVCIGGGAATGMSSWHNDHYDDVDDYHVVQETTIVDGNTVYTVRETRSTSGYFATLVLAIASILTVVIAVVKILVLNPLLMGGRNFFLKNTSGPAEVSDIKRGFTPGYWKTVSTMLLRNVLLFLWTLLLVVPGIIKSYAYYMVPYILAENPEISGMDAIKLSNEMTKGHKMELFILDLSFFGWYLLSAMTFGILGVFYVNPYADSARAECYIALRDGQQMV